MAQVKFVTLDGEQLTVPDRVTGDGPEIEITICATGEFIDPASQELRFMSMPEPPVIERLSVESTRRVAGEVAMLDQWAVSDDELTMAQEEGDQIRKLLRGYYG